MMRCHGTDDNQCNKDGCKECIWNWDDDYENWAEAYVESREV